MTASKRKISARDFTIDHLNQFFAHKSGQVPPNTAALLQMRRRLRERLFGSTPKAKENLRKVRGRPQGL